MEKLIQQQHLLFITLLLLISACSEQVETIVVKNEPDAAVTDTAQTDDSEMEDATFKHLKYGEVLPIKSLDPLFAQNAASQRAVQHVYDGLVKLNKNGKILPAIAKDWKVTSDSLSYRFTLRKDIFYHDSKIFINGLGRRISAKDILFLFERMADRNVPPEAAERFMSIEGFEAYVNEQRHIYLPEERKVKEIQGISLPNDSTVIFNLNRADSHFLTKLASPHASVYPQEAISEQGSSLHDNPVGSGPFQLSSIRGDSLYIFNNNKEYPLFDVNLDRLDIIYEEDELALIRNMGNEEINAIAELGPKMLQAFLTNNLEIKSSYPNAYQAYEGGTITYHLTTAAEKDVDSKQQQLAELLKNYPLSDFSNYINPGAVRVSASNAFNQSQPQAGNNNQNSSLRATFPNDVFIRMYYQRLAGELSNKGISFTMLNTLVPNSQVDIHTHRVDALEQQTGQNELLAIAFQHMAITDGTITGFGLNKYPWWFDVATVDIQPVAR